MAPPFHCEGDHCVQQHPRLPDDHEWECVDLDGIVECRALAQASGIVPGPPDPGWRCGVRRAGAHERLCVARAADRPDGGGWRCKFEHTHGQRRVCVRAPTAPRAAPPDAPPECWLDADCGGRCQAGRCS